MSSGLEGDRVEDDAVFAAFDLLDLVGLLGDAHIFVDDPDAAFLGQGDGQTGLCHRIHGRTDQGDVDRDVTCDLAGGVGLAG